MRVLQIIQGISNPSAGTTYYVAKLADELQRMGNASSILTLGEPPREWSYAAPLVVHSNMLERRAGISLSLLREVRKQALLPGILHGHGIWRITNLFPLMLSGEKRSKILISTHGTLARWSMRYKSFVKAPFWKMLQKPALERSHCFHVTAPAEYEDIRRVGLRGPVAIVPCGVDLPPFFPNTPRMKRLVYLGRIDPIKGLDILIPAWDSLAGQFPDWEMVIAGPLDNDYARSVQKRVMDSKTPRIQFAGQVLGAEKRELLAGSSLFVLPSYSENFGIAVVEALAHGVPVITTTETPWKDIAERGCGWIINPTRDELADTLRAAMRQSSRALEEMGNRGSDWMRESYSWTHIASMMQQTYEWLLHGGRQPDWVIRD